MKDEICNKNTVQMEQMEQIFAFFLCYFKHDFKLLNRVDLNVSSVSSVP